METEKQQQLGNGNKMGKDTKQYKTTIHSLQIQLCGLSISRSLGCSGQKVNNLMRRTQVLLSLCLSSNITPFLEH